MSNEFAIQGSVHRLMRCFGLQLEAGSVDAAVYTDQLSNNVSPFVFTQVSAHTAKRNIAEFSYTSEAFLNKYEELKGRSVRGLDPLIQLISHVVLTPGMAGQLMPAAPTVTTTLVVRDRASAAANRNAVSMTDLDIAKMRESLLKDKDVARFGNPDSRRQQMKLALVKKNPNLPHLPGWCHDQSFLTSDYLPTTRHHISETGSGDRNVDLGSLPVHLQESLVCDDLLCLMKGISGKYICSVDVCDNLDKREFSLNRGLDASLVVFVQRFLPLFTDYSLIVRFVEEKSAFEFGQVNHALCAAMRTLLKEYLVFIAQLDRQKSEGKLQLQKLWFTVQATMNTFHTLAQIVNDINKGGYIGGEVCSVLHSYTVNSVKDPKCQDLCQYLTQAACRPYLDILQEWIYKGQVRDPFCEFMVEQRHSSRVDQLKQTFSADYWEKFYTLVTKNTPVFLDDIRSIILNTGKYLNVVRLYGQEFSFPKPKEIIYTLQLKTYRDILEEAYSFASKLLLDLLIEKEDLKGRLNSVKQYFLMGQGDFFLHFMTIADVELKKQVTDIVPTKLESLLELSLRTSSANSDPFKDDLRAVLLQFDYVTQLNQILAIETAGEKSSIASTPTELVLSGWEAFSIDFLVKWPVNLILNHNMVVRYQMIFRHIFYLKNVEQRLCEVWMDNKDTPAHTPWFTKMFMVRDKMMGFVKNLEIYIMFDVIEPHWHKLHKVLAEVQDVEVLLKSHSAFLDHCMKECMLTTPDLLMIVTKLFARCIGFSNAIRRLTKSAKIQQRDEAIFATDSLHNVASTSKQRGNEELAKSRTTAKVEANHAHDMTKGPNIEQMIKTYEKDFNKDFIKLLDRLHYYEKREAELSMINVISRLDYNGYYANLLAKSKEKKLLQDAAKKSTKKRPEKDTKPTELKSGRGDTK